MTGELHEIFSVYLTTQPLLWLTVTLVAFQVGTWMWQLAKLNPLVNPVLIAILILMALLRLTGTDYHTYFAGAQFIHFLLGPATVALAIPLYRQIQVIRKSALAILVALVCGSATAVARAALLGWGLGGSRQTVLSMIPKSVTTPIAMGVSETIGGLASLTTVVVILTGVVGASLGPWLLNRLRIKDPHARGLAMGTAAHGFGTARSLEEGEVNGAFAGLAMGLNGLLTAIAVPLLVHWVLG
jgi:predicted murein hydrolase (TIGR00659 family)